MRRGCVVAALCAWAGCSAPVTPGDAGGGAGDAGPIARDAGSILDDAGVASIDGGDASDGGSDVDGGPLEPFEGCPGDALRIDGAWDMRAIDTAEYGEFGGNVLVVRVSPPAGATGTGTATSGWVEYAAGPTVRHAIFSTRPCDFDPAHALRNASGGAFVSTNQIRFSFAYTFGPARTTAAHIDPGGTYYINVRNAFADGSPSCTISDCRMRGGLPSP